MSPGRALLGFVLAVVLWTLAFASLAAEPEVAARATAILNQVEALSADGVTRRLARGDLIYVGETLTTGPKGRAQLRFTDRGVMTLRPATRLSIDDYRFDPAAPALNRQNLSVDQGGFRAATGAVADSNREGYRVASPLGVVGVRGTNYEAVLTPSNNLVLGAYEGTIDVTSPTGNVAVLGEGADFNFARVDSSGGVEYLLEPPEELASSAGVADDQEDAEESEEDTEESEDSEESEEDGDSGEEESEDAGEEAEEE
ncbi:MAG: FecR family protein, partial [Pseudomonadales bacterium]